MESCNIILVRSMMPRAYRLPLAVVTGGVVAAIIVFLGVVLDNLGLTFGHAIHNVFISPGLAFSAPFGYAVCPLFAHSFGWNGPGGAYFQMLLVSFVTWAVLFSIAAYIIFARKKTVPT